MKKTIAIMLVLVLAFALSACADKANAWNDVTMFKVIVNGTTLSGGNTYVISEGDEISISTNGDRIYYKIGESDMVEIVGSEVTITIPTKYTNTGAFSFQVCATRKSEQAEWVMYILDVRS